MERILVAYGSQYGATAEIADAIGTTLQEHGFEVEVRRASDVASVADYRAVVLGSAVYMKRWRRDAMRLLRRNADELSKRDVWLFNSGPVGDQRLDETDESSEWTRPEKTRLLGEQIGVHDNVVFGGMVDDDRGFIRRKMAKNTSAEGRDLRDWQQISEWSTRIAAVLKGPDAQSLPPGAVTGEPDLGEPRGGDP